MNRFFIFILISAIFTLNTSYRIPEEETLESKLQKIQKYIKETNEIQDKLEE